MSVELIAIVVSVVAIVVAAYSVYKANQAGTELTPAFLTSTLEEATVTATKLTEVALTAAQAAEQLYKSGKIDRTARLDAAFQYVRTWFPDLDQARILTAIEAGVFVVNTAIDSLPKKAVVGQTE